jgi:hypothetical protein
VIWLLRRLRNTRFHGGSRDVRTWREGVLSLTQRRCNETNQYHPAQQSPHENDRFPWNENVHRRPPGTKSGSRFTAIIPPKTSNLFRENQMFIVMSEELTREILSTVAARGQISSPIFTSRYMHRIAAEAHQIKWF